MKFQVALAALLSLTVAGPAQAGPTKTQLTADGRLLLNGQPTFFIGTAPGPNLDLKTPEGTDGWTELVNGGINVVRSYPGMNDTSTSILQSIKGYLDTAAAHHMYVWPFIGHPVENDSPQARDQLKQIVLMFKEHPAVFFWKFADEAAWGKVSPAALQKSYQLVRSLDPNHLVWISQAPVIDPKRYAAVQASDLAPYTPAADVFAIDIYPIPANNATTRNNPNKGLSVVGDLTRVMRTASGPQKMIFMILQVFWSGVTPTDAHPERQIVFPNAREERFMTYDAIINGADSLSYFGLCMPDKDVQQRSRNEDIRRYGCNWTFWRNVLKPILAELKPGSELYPALVGPDVKNAVKYTAAPQIEVRCKQANAPMSPLYILAAAREGATQQVTFSGFQANDHSTIDVLYENRKIQPKGNSFTDTFAEHDVHIYRVTTPQTER